jgi:hypothetical protein
MAQYFVDIDAVSTDEIAAAPAADKNHRIVSFILTTDTAGKITVGPLTLNLTVGINAAVLPEPIPLDAATALVVDHSAGGSLRGMISAGIGLA